MRESTWKQHASLKEEMNSKQNIIMLFIEGSYVKDLIVLS